MYRDVNDNPAFVNTSKNNERKTNVRACRARLEAVCSKVFVSVDALKITTDVQHESSSILMTQVIFFVVSIQVFIFSYRQKNRIVLKTVNYENCTDGINLLGAVSRALFL